MSTFRSVLELWDKSDESCPKMTRKGLPFSLIRDIEQEWEMVQEYAASIGCTAIFHLERLPNNMQQVTTVKTYRCGFERRTNKRMGRMGSSIICWTLAKPKEQDHEETGT